MGNTGHEQVGVKTGVTVEADDGAGGDFNGNQRTAHALHFFTRQILQAGIEIQGDILSRNRVLLFDHTDDTAAGIGFHFLVANFTVQIIFVLFFNTDFTDHPGGAVTALHIVVGVDAFLLTLRNAADIAQSVSKGFALRVMPYQLGFDIHAGQVEAVHHYLGDVFFAQLVAQHYRFIRAATGFTAFFKLLNIALTDTNQLIEKVQGFVHILHPFRHQSETVGRNIFCQQYAVAVVDQATVRRNWTELNPVVFGEVFVFFMQGNLQVGHAPGEDTEEYQDKHSQDNGPGAEQAVLRHLISE